MAAKRYGEPRKNNLFRYLYFVLFGLIALWLLASIIFKTSPIDLINNSFSKIGEKVVSSVDDNGMTMAQKDSLILELQKQLESIKTGGGSYQKAMVIINSSHLNMRDKPSLSSSIVMQIPAESVVDLLFFDTETFFLEGKPGKWAKIKYAEEEGWVWGNFIKKIDEGINIQ